MRIRTIRGLGVNTHIPNLSTTKKRNRVAISIQNSSYPAPLFVILARENKIAHKKNSYPACLFVVLPRAIQIWLYSNILS